METTFDFTALTLDESMNCTGGGFAYDAGCVIGFLVRYAQGMVGEAEAYAIWYAQHSK